MKILSSLRPMTLTTAQAAYTAVTLLVVLPLILSFTFMNSIYAAYLDHFVVPTLEQKWGLHGEYDNFKGTEATYRLYVFTEIEPGGRFGDAGVRVGETPCRHEHGVSEVFDELRRVRGGSVRVLLCHPPELSRREVDIVAPPAN